MAQDSLLVADTIISRGSINTDNGNFKTDGTNGNITMAGAFAGGQQTGTVTTLSTGNTIVFNNLSSVRVTAAAAITGVILTAGTRADQTVTVIHEGAAGNTITMAASGTSNVANGASCVITGPSARTFKWDAITALWYQCA